MRTLKFREYIEYRPKRKNSPDYMKYDPNFIGDINETFNHNLESSGTKITYMQYTGINDKNGKEIYEGDIIKYRLEIDDHSQYLLVTFNADKAAFCAGSNSWKDVSRNGEVIGNKYENPELLEKTIEPKMKFYRFIKPFRSLIVATSEENALQIYKNEHDEVDDNDDFMYDEVSRLRNLFFDEKALLFPYLAAPNQELQQELFDEATSRECLLLDEDDFKYMEERFCPDDLDNMED